MTDVTFPVGVKPAVKEDFFYATKAKAWRANNANELRTLFKGLRPRLKRGSGSGNYSWRREIYQFSSCVFLKDGKVLSMEAQRWRLYPPEFGRAATFVETIDLPELEEPTLRFLNHRLLRSS